MPLVSVALDTLFLFLVGLVTAMSIYLFCKRCKKDMTIIHDLTSDSQVVPVESMTCENITVQASIVHITPQVPELP